MSTSGPYRTVEPEIPEPEVIKHYVNGSLYFVSAKYMLFTRGP